MAEAERAGRKDRKPGNRAPEQRVFENYQALTRRCMAFDQPKSRAHVEARRLIAIRLHQILIDLISLTPVGTAIEIGAHEAGFSQTIRNALGDIECVAFEANPYVYEKFAAGVAANDVRYIRKAVGRVDGQAEFHIPVQLGGRPLPQVNPISGLRQRNAAGCAYENVSVDVTTLDSFCNEEGLPAPFALWVDVEGAQIDVIEGAGATLARTDILFIEVETHEFWSEQVLEETVTDRLRAMGFIPILRDLENPRQFNILFVRQDVAREHAKRILREQREFVRLMKRMRKANRAHRKARKAIRKAKQDQTRAKPDARSPAEDR